MKHWKLIAYTLGILTSYYCMSIWGMGMRNPVKYYLYLPVLLCCFLLLKELQYKLQQNNQETVVSNIVFVLIGTLILAGLTAVAFSSYESSILKR
jgi:hypothetical protein